MFPRWHILYGAIFALFLGLLMPKIQVFYLLAIFLSSFLIDFDHYMIGVLHTKSLNLFKILNHFKKLNRVEADEHIRGIHRRGHFMVFHTLEFHLLIAILAFFFPIFLYVLIGMLFHSVLDLADMSKKGLLYRREFFFINWLRNQFK